MLDRAIRSALVASTAVCALAAADAASAESRSSGAPAQASAATLPKAQADAAGSERRAEGDPLSGAYQVNELIVTARRREETVQDVPATLSVLTNKAIFLSGADSMNQLRDVIPNLQFASDVPVRSRVSVRGLGSDRSGVQANGVGLFIDGVYQNSTARFNAPFFDVERVEVLKGPQGARYGRNAFAGVVNIVTRKPNNEFRGGVEAGVETEGGVRYAGMISGPILAERLYGKLSYSHSQSDGDYKNAVTGKDMAPSRSDAFTARVVADITSDLEIDTAYSKSRNAGGGFPVSETSSLQHLTENFVVTDDQRASTKDDDFYVKGTWSGEHLQVMNRFAYNRERQDFRLDGDVSRYNGVLSTGQFEFKTWSNELRVQSVGAGPLTWMFGGEAVGQKADRTYRAYFGPEVDLALLGVRNPALVAQLMAHSPSTTTNSGKTDIWSVFGEVSYTVLDLLELTASARYDDIAMSAYNPSVATLGGAGFGRKIREKAPQPLFSARYRADEDTSIYATAARGIRQGGFNAASLTRAYGAFDADSMWAYEVGIKRQLPRLRGHLNLAAFYMDASNLNHASIIQTDSGTLTAGAISLGGATSKGVEFDTSIQPRDHVTLALAGGYLDCRYVGIPPLAQRPADLQKVTLGDRNGDRCQDSARWTLNASISGEYPLPGDWMGIGTLSVAGKGKTRLIGDPLFREAESTQAPYWLLNMTVGVQKGPLSVVAYAQNLTDELYATSHQSADLLHANGVLGATNFATVLAPRRRVGIKARWDF